jgi:hypothetical protein
MKSIHLVLCILLISLTGCSTPKIEQDKLTPEYRSTNLSKQIFNRNIYVKIANKNISKFELAIVSALRERDMYAQDISNSKYILSVKLIEEKAPKAGFSIEGSITAEYELIDRTLASGDSRYLILRERIFSNESAGITDESYGPARAVMVIQNYVKSNIRSFLVKIDEASIKIKNRNEIDKNEAAEKTRILISLRSYFSQYDIFSSTPFYEAYPYRTWRNYELKEVAQYTTSNLVPRLNNASRNQLEIFKKNYYHLLDPYFTDKVDSLLLEKSKQPKTEAVQRNLTKPTKDGVISGGLPPLK